jgi:hypothetical protein
MDFFQNILKIKPKLTPGQTLNGTSTPAYTHSGESNNNANYTINGAYIPYASFVFWFVDKRPSLLFGFVGRDQVQQLFRFVFLSVEEWFDFTYTNYTLRPLTVWCLLCNFYLIYEHTFIVWCATDTNFRLKSEIIERRA